MSVTPIAILSDVHGNVTAYQAVLDDLDRRGIEHVINLGDVAGKGPRGSAAIAMTQQRCSVTVRGNWDTWLAGTASAKADQPSRWWRAELTDSDRDWLGLLPNIHQLQISGRWLRLLHATSTSELVRMFPRHTDEEFAAMFDNTDFTGNAPRPMIVGCGDVHATYLRVEPGRMLFNAGSVGNALDEPTAAYVIIEGYLGEPDPAPIDLRFVRVPYDVESELTIARDLQMPTYEAYASELRTATYHRHAPGPPSETNAVRVEQFEKFTRLSDPNVMRDAWS